AVEFWGQGITPKAVEMAIPLILEEFPEIVRLQALTDAKNKASHRVLEKAGFRKEGMFRKYFYFKGEIKDVVLYSFLSTDS
uniref:N-acetyltransferase domain-containing protein n=2 Tax=Solanum lycopersicum TaxID=4081 RepID=A0A3Q7ENN9_SOLLC